MKIQCLIDRDGVTTASYNGKRFDFIKNEHGHYVCDVANPGAANYFLQTFKGNFYKEYVEPAKVEQPLIEKQEEPKQEKPTAVARLNEKRRKGAK